MTTTNDSELKPLGRQGVLDAVLPAETAWALLRKHGSYTKATEALAAMGVTNPITGEPYRRMSVVRQVRKSEGYQDMVRQQHQIVASERAKIDA